jgi:hypothetical protein
MYVYVWNWHRVHGTNLIGDYVMENIDVSRLIAVLSKKFPDVWFKDGWEFSQEHIGTIWTGEGSYIGDEGQWEAFDYYGYDSTFGVHPKLAHAIDSLGLFAEFYDAGTVFFYKK